jgi:hypothetical protein
MEEGFGWILGIGMVIGIIVFLFKLAVTILLLAMAIVIAAAPAGAILYAIYWTTSNVSEHIERRYGWNKKILLILILNFILGILLGGLLSGTWLRLSISYVFIITVLGISGTTLSALLIYPYVKYLYAMSAYRKREQHLIKP